MPWGRWRRVAGALTVGVSVALVLVAGASSVGQTRARGDLLFPCLSEVMASPPPGVPEYIELYNPHPIAISLSALHIEIGRDAEHLKSYPLEGLAHVPPRSYVVLTSQPDSLARHYPEAAPERMLRVRLPRLRNAGCRIHLVHDGALLDSVSYSPGRLDRGVRTQRGVSLERRTPLEPDDPPSDLWRSARAEMQHATPTRPNSIQHLDPGAETEEHGTLSLYRLLERVKATEPGQLSVYIYNTEGKLLMRYTGAEAYLWASGLLNERARGRATLSSISGAVLFAHFCLGGERYVLRF